MWLTPWDVETVLKNKKAYSRQYNQYCHQHWTNFVATGFHQFSNFTVIFWSYTYIYNFFCLDLSTMHASKTKIHLFPLNLCYWYLISHSGRGKLTKTSKLNIFLLRSDMCIEMGVNSKGKKVGSWFQRAVDWNSPTVYVHFATGVYDGNICSCNLSVSL